MISLTRIGSALPPTGTTGSSYTFTVPASNGTSFAVTSGSLPLGLTLNPTTGVITGTPTTVGSSTFTVTGGDTGPASRSYTITVAAVSPLLPLGATGTILLGGVLLLLTTRRRRRSTRS